jgi:hypothetical protein
MGRKTPTKWTPRDVTLFAMWIIVAGVWGFVAMNFAALRGCEAWRNWNASQPLPEGGPRVVRLLEEYKARHGRYPAALVEAGSADGLPEESRLDYRLVEGSGAQEFELVIGVYPNRGYEFDSYWSYESRRGRWTYWSIFQGGG